MANNTFETRLTWHPMDKPFTYKEYSRMYTIRADGKPDFVGTAAPDYAGSKYHYNPEDMLVMSLSACHMLSYLAYAANSRVKVLTYHDQASGELFKDGNKIRFRNVILRPQLLISKDSDLELAKKLHHKAHDACFIANSVNFDVDCDPTIKAGELPLIHVA